MRLFRDKSQVTAKCSRNKQEAHEAQPGVAHFWFFFFFICYWSVLYCAVLYCTVLYCAVLYCTVLCCTVLYCAVLYCTVLCQRKHGIYLFYITKKQIVSMVTSSMGLSSNRSKLRTTESSCVVQLQNADKQGQMYNLFSRLCGVIVRVELIFTISFQLSVVCVSLVCKYR